jgi:hypothetical protein
LKLPAKQLNQVVLKQKGAKRVCTLGKFEERRDINKAFVYIIIIELRITLHRAMGR